jgi:TRAP-type C4-dicarboxylate transport system permease large subunit
LTTNPFVFLFIVQVIFLSIGTIMDGVPALLILMPILAPISVEYGIEPIHFGILVAANLAIGLITPPIGLVLSTAAAVAKLPIERVVRPLMPLLAVLIAMLMLLTYVEDVSMLLPRLVGLD